MKVESITECSIGTFSNIFDLRVGIIRLENIFMGLTLSGCFRQVLLYLLENSIEAGLSLSLPASLSADDF